MTRYNIENVSEKLIESITSLLEEFDIDYEDHGNRVMFACPIHGGTNPTGSSIMKNGIGNWRCFTEQCHEKQGTSNGASIIQFIQELLTQRNNRPCSFYEAIQWAAQFVGEESEQDAPIPTAEDNTRTSFIQLCKYINRKKADTHPIFTPRSLVKSFLKIPAEYYIERGYSASILEKFDIGYCFNTNKPFFDRVVTPFYDDNGEYMVGASGRSKFERCDRCRFHHAVEVRCPITKEEKVRATKWKHSSKFSIESYLYNYCNAKSHILKNHTVIIVEGPGDVWRLEEGGIHNSLAILGASLSSTQQMLLENSGAINLIIATDNDEAGNKAANHIIHNCNRIFNIQRLVYPTKDPGSLSVEQVKQIFIPVLERI